MSKTPLPYIAADISSVARSLREQLGEHAPQQEPPSHVALLNMLARAVGKRNFQAFRAASTLVCQLDQRAAPAPAVELAPPAGADRFARLLDAEGRVNRWPIKRRPVQLLILWYIWSKFPARRMYTEREVNAVIKAWETFGDHVLLRRELVELGLLKRTKDGSEYRKVAVKPSPEISAFLRQLQQSADSTTAA